LGDELLQPRLCSGSTLLNELDTTGLAIWCSHPSVLSTPVYLVKSRVELWEQTTHVTCVSALADVRTSPGVGRSQNPQLGEVCPICSHVSMSLLAAARRRFSFLVSYLIKAPQTLFLFLMIDSFLLLLHI
jgi:hypothetical protein